ncbi:hypothetical protein BD311DRAFT_747129 [Dichomitus squalens]|uniref:Uncharacterized protein n=1 Tax=Dichomitus squalens TaxID=114155 RepID=A0A4Q9N2F2_9APHY|nr:hypothetical protein BD311DRAFT_747129 [Dichomitus squalens]
MLWRRACYQIINLSAARCAARHTRLGNRHSSSSVSVPRFVRTTNHNGLLIFEVRNSSLHLVSFRLWEAWSYFRYKTEHDGPMAPLQGLAW